MGIRRKAVVANEMVKCRFFSLERRKEGAVMIKGALFDMDGLLFDTEALALQGWLSAAKKYNYPITVETVNYIRGTNVAYSRDYFQKQFGDAVDYELARKERTDYVNRSIEENGVPLKEGVMELLTYLKEEKIKCAVATSTHENLAQKYLMKAGIYDYFDAWVYGDGIKKGKPDPEIFITAAKSLGLPCEECVVFEDSPHGIKAAHSAGCKVIAVPDLTEIEGETLLLVDACVTTLRDAKEKMIEWTKKKE